MNKSYDIKSGEVKEDISDSDLELINGFARKELKKDEIYAFSVVLCDNEVDRDFERFTVDAIEKLAELFVGRTAIKNHSMNCEDQSARTYRTEVITDTEKKNSLGENYVYLKAYCYMPKIEKNESLIAEIQSGIKKEVSIGCSVESSICSVCGTDSRSSVCSHKKGKKYKGKLCYYELVNPTDAYEWSFVAVPAQKNAGVIKSYQPEGVRTMNDVIKSIKEADGETVLSPEEAKAIAKYIGNLEEKSHDAEEYRKSLEEAAVKLFAITVPSLSNDYTQSICKTISTNDLKELCKALEEKKQARSTPQLFREKDDNKDDGNSQFRF